jgi:hypothetical protein
MRTAIVVPRRAHWWRDRLWDYVKRTWDSDAPMFEVYHEGGLFNRSWCINEGARQAGNWEVLVIADADVIVPMPQVERAVMAAVMTGRYTVAGTERIAFAQGATERVLRGWPRERWGELRIERCREHRPCRVSTHDFNSNIVAVPRALWEEVGGFDERFEGWGHEDGAFVAAVTTYWPGVERIPGTVYHLWHERAPERSRAHPRYGRNRDLRVRYTEARGDPGAMRDLLDERLVPA